MKTYILPLTLLLPLAFAGCVFRQSPPPVPTKLAPATLVSPLSDLVAYQVSADEVLFPLEKFATWMGFDVTVEKSTKLHIIKNGGVVVKYQPGTSDTLGGEKQLGEPMTVNGEIGLPVDKETTVLGLRLAINSSNSTVEITEMSTSKKVAMKLVKIDKNIKLAAGKHMLSEGDSYWLGWIENRTWVEDQDKWENIPLGTKFNMSFFHGGLKGGTGTITTAGKALPMDSDVLEFSKDTPVGVQSQKKLNDFGFTIDSDESKYMPTLGISDCTWDPYAHPAIRNITPTATHTNAVKEFMRKNGLEGEPIIDVVMEADIDNDGKVETVLSFISAGFKEFPGPNREYPQDEYSAVLYIDEVAGKTVTGIINGDWFAANTLVACPSVFKLGDIMDADGDGQNEVMVFEYYYEGLGYNVMKFVNGTFINVASGGEGA